MVSLSGPGAPRTIIHVDLDAFYCAVEEKRDPALCGRAFAVGARAEERGVVASCSYPARRCGVRSAMAMGLAQRLCPQLLVVPMRHAIYRAVSKQVMDLLHGFTPKLEQLSIDEAFLNVTELLAKDHSLTGGAVALEIQRRVEEELGLSCSLGVASNKMVAKIATDCGKAGVSTGHSPQALCVVESGEEAAFLAPLPVSALWGVGPKLEARLRDLGIETIGQLARWDERDLMRRFGKHGADLARHAKGIDKREVTTERESKSISIETTFVQDVIEWEGLHATLVEQAQSVAAQLKKQHLQGTTVKIKLRWSDFTFSTKQTTLFFATDAAPSIEGAATSLLTQLWASQAPVRLLGVGVSGLSPVRQLGLFDSLPEITEFSEAEPAPSEPAPLNPEVVDVPHHTKIAPSAPQVVKPNHDHDIEKQKRWRDAVALLETRFGRDVVHLGAR